jgi:hypothetical protein
MTIPIFGFDPGKRQDPSALVLGLREDRPGGLPVYHFDWIKRWPLGTPHREVRQDVVKVMTGSGVVNAFPTLVIDQTGVGEGEVEVESPTGPERMRRGDGVRITWEAGHRRRDDRRSRAAHRPARQDRRPGFRHGEGNSDSHIKASLIGSGTTVHVVDGDLAAPCGRRLPPVAERAWRGALTRRGLAGFLRPRPLFL